VNKVISFILPVALMLFTAQFAQAQIKLEAENAHQILAPFKIISNSTASGGRLVVRPAGGTTARGVMTFNLSITQAGNYYLTARAYAENTSSNSVLVRVNGGDRILWTMPVKDVWQMVRFSKTLSFAKGNQVLQIYSDKPDTGIDRLELQLVSPSPTPTPTPTPSPTPKPSPSATPAPSATPTPSPTPSPTPAPVTGLTRGLWVWTTSQVLASSSETDLFIQMCVQSGITDVYLYLVQNDYSAKAAGLKNLNSLLRAKGIRPWGLEGYRGYFSDSYGPQGIYNVVNAMISFNAGAAANQKFYGFQSDMEPQDGQGSEFPNTFHNDLTNSQLSTTSGGVWYASQAQDREMLLRDWLQIHAKLKSMTLANGLKLGAAMPSWTDDYYGQEVSVTYNNIRQGVMKHMMGILDEYAIMSYNVDPNNAANRVRGELQYADTLPVDRRPRVFAGVETHKGVGGSISYGDSATKNSRTAVLSDIATLNSLLKSYSSFGGVNIHDWEGWKGLRP